MTMIVCTLILCVVLVGCTVFIVMALANIMAAIARHNKHMDDMKLEVGRIGTMFSSLTSTMTGLANYYKRSEDDKKVG